MTEQTPRWRLATLILLLAAELGLVYSLRSSGWRGTAQHAQLIATGIAVLLPLAMTAMWAGRVRLALTNRQVSLRDLLAFTILIGAYLAWIPLFRPHQPDWRPYPIARSARLEVFLVVPTPVAGGTTLQDPETGEVLALATLPTLTGANVISVEAVEPEGLRSLAFRVDPIGTNNLKKATAAGTGRLVTLVNGEAVAVARFIQPIGGSGFTVSSNAIQKRLPEIFKTLTVEE